MKGRELTEERLHGMLVWDVLAMAVLTFLYLFRRAAPHGRHYAGAGWGPHISARFAWVIMELPVPVRNPRAQGNTRPENQAYDHQDLCPKLQNYVP